MNIPQCSSLATSLYQLAKNNYCDSAISNLVASAPATLDTLNELALALGNDANYATTTATLIGTKAPISTTVDLSNNQTITGTKTFNSLPLSSVVPTLINQLANKSFVDSSISGSGYVNLTIAQTIGGIKTFTSPITLSAGTNTSTINELFTALNLTNNNNSGSFGFMTKDSLGTVYQPLNITASQTKIQTNLSISDPTTTYTTHINNVLQSTNINNNNVRPKLTICETLIREPVKLGNK